MDTFVNYFDEIRNIDMSIMTSRRPIRSYGGWG